jgi:serine acetyltransferase
LLYASPIGKECGDRHPKVGNGVILYDSCTVLGNIAVGDGSVVMPKSIVTKPVPPLGCVSGVPAKLQSHQRVFLSAVATEVIDRKVKTDWVTCAQRYLQKIYMKQWDSLEALEHPI